MIGKGQACRAPDFVAGWQSSRKLAMLFSRVLEAWARGMIRVKRLARLAEVDAVAGMTGASRRGSSQVDVLAGGVFARRGCLRA